MTPEMKQFDQSARTWLSGAEFPREFGNSFVIAIERTVQKTKNMTEKELEDYGYCEYAKLQRAYGDGLEDKLRAAGQMVEALDQKTPGLKNLLRSKGIGDSAMVVSLLIQQATIFHARHGR